MYAPNAPPVFTAGAAGPYTSAMIPRTALLTALVFATLASASCATRYSSAALGQYEEFQPFIWLRNTQDNRARYELEITRPAFVSILTVSPPAGGFEDRPVMFDVVYPRYDTDPVEFTAGRHQLITRVTPLMPPRNCGYDEPPTLGGCRRPQYQLPGMRAGRPPTGPPHYLVIAADEFVDPYTLADELHYVAMEQPELGDALRSGTIESASALLERVLLDRRGTPFWAGLYIVSR